MFAESQCCTTKFDSRSTPSQNHRRAVSPRPAQNLRPALNLRPVPNRQVQTRLGLGLGLRHRLDPDCHCSAA